MKLLDKQKDDAELFDSNQYWFNQELKVLDEESALERQLLPRDYDPEKIKSNLNDGMKEKKNISDTVKAIDAEIISRYREQVGTDDLNSMGKEKMDDLMLFSPLPRLRFLLQKRAYLIMKKKLEDNYPHDSANKTVSDKNKPLSTVYSSKKKVIHLAESAWGGVQSFYLSVVIPAAMPVISGVFGFIAHVVEGFQSAKFALYAYRNEHIRQRKTHIATNVVSVAAAGAGVGIALTYLAGIAGASVAGATITLAPFIISALLVGISSLGLWRNAYVLVQVKMDEAEAVRDYKSRQELKNELRFKVHALEMRKGAITIKIQSILLKQGKNESLSDDETKSYQEYKNIMRDLSEAQANFAHEAVPLAIAKQRCKLCHENRFQAERKIAFNTMGIAASALALTATILGVAALVGASVASFGGVPLALLVAGFALGIACKLVDYYDGRKDYAYTRKLSHWFTEKWNHFTHAPKEAIEVEDKIVKTKEHKVSISSHRKSVSTIHPKLSQSASPPVLTTILASAPSPKRGALFSEGGEKGQPVIPSNGLTTPKVK